MDNASLLSQQLQIPAHQVAAALDLLEHGNTLPFVARYRKEVTGGLDEEQLRRIQESWGSLKALQERRAAILKSLQEQGVLTPQLQAQVEQAPSLTLLEDLYLPHRPKRKTRASQARERGLQGLADLILAQQPGRDTPEHLAQPFLNEQVATVAEALAGARDIVAETIAETPAVRQRVRDKALRFGRLHAEKLPKAEDPKGTFTHYYQFGSLVSMLRPHQTLALDRGEHEKVLSVGVDLEERDWREAISAHYRTHPKCPLASALAEAIDDCAKRLLLPAIERDVRRQLSEIAHEHAIATFATNLRGLLTVPPLNRPGMVVLGVDPGFRTGCKLAVVDATGKVLATDAVFLHREAETRRRLRQIVDSRNVTLIAIGNGTASRESEQLVAELLREKGDKNLGYLMVNEAGASVYSASPLARAELPELDVTLRGAVSIARRVLDPLAELVKIEPRSIGVGLYQHDVEGKQLDEALAGVVESVVNRVGVDLNTASPALLTHVAGIGPKLADKIVAHRDQSGAFRSRAGLLKVAGLGPKAFEQAAGFLRVRGSNPLDASAIHPESYGTAEKVLAANGLTLASSMPEREQALRPQTSKEGVATLARRLQVGEPTLVDILEQLIRPGRDPREDFPAPVLRQDVLSLDDLQPGQSLNGTVRNVVDFGAFVDIGVKQDGLLHRSRVPRGQTLAVGQVIEVEVVEIDRARGRISLAFSGK